MSKFASLKAILAVKDTMSPVLKQVEKNWSGMTKLMNNFKATGANKQFKIMRKTLRNVGYEFKDVARTIGLPFTTLAGSLGLSMNSILDSFSSTGDQYDKMSLRLQVNAETLQEWNFAAGHAGASIEHLEKGVGEINKVMGTIAAGGGKEAKQLFSALGISITDATGKLKNAEQLFPEIADAIKVNEDPVMRQKIAFTLMGRAGRELIPTLQDGAAGLRAQAAEARRLGLVMDKDAIAKAAAMTDHLDDMKAVIKSVALAIGTIIAPTVIRLSDNFSDLIVKNRELFSKRFSNLASQFAEVLQSIPWSAIVSVVITFVEWGLKLFNLLGGVKTVLIGVAAVMGYKMIVSVMNLSSALLSLGKAVWLATGPVGLIVGAVAAFAAGLVWAWKNVDGFREHVIDMFKGVGQVVYGLFEVAGGVFLLFRGDTATLIAGLKNIWKGFQGWFGGLWDSTLDLLRPFKSLFPESLRNMASSAVDAFVGTFKTVVDKIKGIFDSIMSSIPEPVREFLFGDFDKEVRMNVAAPSLASNPVVTAGGPARDMRGAMEVHVSTDPGVHATLEDVRASDNLTIQGDVGAVRGVAFESH